MSKGQLKKLKLTIKNNNMSKEFQLLMDAINVASISADDKINIMTALANYINADLTNLKND